MTKLYSKCGTHCASLSVNKCWPARMWTYATSVHSHSTLQPKTHPVSKTTPALTVKNYAGSTKPRTQHAHASWPATSSSHACCGSQGRKRRSNQGHSTPSSNKATTRSTATSTLSQLHANSIDPMWTVSSSPCSSVFKHLWTMAGTSPLISGLHICTSGIRILVTSSRRLISNLTIWTRIHTMIIWQVVFGRMISKRVSKVVKLGLLMLRLIKINSCSPKHSKEVYTKIHLIWSKSKVQFKLSDNYIE